MTTTEQLLALGAMLPPTLCVLALVRERPPGPRSAFLALLALVFTSVWFLHKAPYEGPAIITLTQQHGLTVDDLVVPPSVAIEAAVLWRARAALLALASRL